MAIIKCPNCGHVVSDRADSCPNCGFRLQQPVNQYPSPQNTQQSYQAGANQQQGYQPIFIQTQRNQSVCPKTWMVESILVTIFCCLPFGIAGIVNASKVSSRFAAGLYDEAQMASKSAGRFTTIALVCGLIGDIIYIIILIVGGSLAALGI